MESSSHFKSWKRMIDSEQEEGGSWRFRNIEESQQQDYFPDPKKLRPDIDGTFHRGSASQSSSIPPPESRCFTTGHTYGSSAVYDDGRLQNGDAYYTAGPSSQIWGPSVLNGEMRVHLSNVFHTYNYGFPNPSTQEAQEHALKSLLYYRSMDDRKAQLKVVDPATFKWVWTQTAFPKWLTSEEGIFWISGKPASGKSTLIHYLSGRSQFSEVVRCLQRSGRRWLLIRFYFDFRAGANIANSMLGMLRSLLLQLVEESAEIRNIVLKRCGHRLQGSWPELESEVLELICEAIRLSGISICGFIDGLDEYAGSLSKLIDFLLIVQKRTSIKICLASRPEPELLHRLRGVPTFAMQDYNQETIKAYIESAIADIGQLASVKQLRDVLEEEVVAHASGVILWAVFAVDGAVKAALHGCVSAEIRQFVRSFPQELSSVYKRIWDKLTPSDQRLAATILFVVQHWESSFHGFEPRLILSSSHLTSCCKTILQRLDRSLQFDTDYSELHFRLKTYALLGGLVEFVGQNHEARLVHKSVQSFLEHSVDYAHQVADIGKVVDMRLLGPRFFADAVIEISGNLLPSRNRLLNVDRHMNVLAKEFWGPTAASSTDGRQLILYRNWFGRDIFLNSIKETINNTLACVWQSAQFHNNLQQTRHAALIVPISQRLLSPSLRHLLISMQGLPPMFHPTLENPGHGKAHSHKPGHGKPLATKAWTASHRLTSDQTKGFKLASFKIDDSFKLVEQQVEELNKSDWELFIRILLQLWINPSVVKQLDPIWREYIDLLRDDPDSLRQGLSRAAILKAWKSYARRTLPQSVRVADPPVSNTSMSPWT